MCFHNVFLKLKINHMHKQKKKVRKAKEHENVKVLFRTGQHDCDCRVVLLQLTNLWGIQLAGISVGHSTSQIQNWSLSITCTEILFTIYNKIILS